MDPPVQMAVVVTSILHESIHGILYFFCRTSYYNLSSKTNGEVRETQLKKCSLGLRVSVAAEIVTTSI